MALNRCLISRIRRLKLLEFLVAQVTARTAADLVGIHRNSAELHYDKLRQLTAEKMRHVEPELGVRAAGGRSQQPDPAHRPENPLAGRFCGPHSVAGAATTS